jgi:hypothetical protein
MPNGAPAPLRDPIARKSDGLMTAPWVTWFTQLTTDLDAAPERLDSVTVTGQTASISPTALDVGSLSQGLYRVTWRARITQAATVSSSLVVTVGYTESAITMSESGTAITGNTTSTVASGSFLVAVDQGTPITFSTTYASTGASVMAYTLTIVAEEMDA